MDNFDKNDILELRNEIFELKQLMENIHVNQKENITNLNSLEQTVNKSDDLSCQYTCNEIPLSLTKLELHTYHNDGKNE